MAMSKEAQSTIESQEARMAAGGARPKVLPYKKLDEVVSLLEKAGFTHVEKNEETEWTCYRSPQVLLVLDRMVEVAKGREVLQRVSIWKKDGIKVYSDQIGAIWKELGL